MKNLLIPFLLVVTSCAYATPESEQWIEDYVTLVAEVVEEGQAIVASYEGIRLKYNLPKIGQLTADNVAALPYPALVAVQAWAVEMQARAYAYRTRLQYMDTQTAQASFHVSRLPKEQATIVMALLAALSEELNQVTESVGVQ